MRTNKATFNQLVELILIDVKPERTVAETVKALATNNPGIQTQCDLFQAALSTKGLRALDDILNAAYRNASPDNTPSFNPPTLG